jgi:hypothetical protein
MFELLQSPTPPKRSFLTWLAAACLLLGACFLIASTGHSLLGVLFTVAGNILGMVAARQKEEVGLPSLSPAQKT